MVTNTGTVDMALVLYVHADPALPFGTNDWDDDIVGQGPLHDGWNQIVFDRHDMPVGEHELTIEATPAPAQKPVVDDETEQECAACGAVMLTASGTGLLFLGKKDLGSGTKQRETDA